MIRFEHAEGSPEWLPVPAALLADHNIGYPEREFYAQLMAYSGGAAAFEARFDDLAAFTRRSRNNCMKMVDNLAAAGWLTRTTQRTSRRRAPTHYVLHGLGKASELTAA